MIISEMSGTANGELAIDDFEAYRELKKWIQENRKEWEISHVAGTRNIFPNGMWKRKLRKWPRKSFGLIMADI
ncbi:hypothetical protein KEH51_24700 [[Brevibacterium] frigoritolerans]|uniref:Uncharacterized protein n=1 Tax=Peribacillus frigoritolerans TaxID=450367 RepID=A0A941FJP7_9BACI|nr:hypothetical protein [Peribacillus frigoritolerans]